MHSIQIWKICSLVSMKYFVFWVFTNAILFTSYSIILYHNYLNKRNKYFKKIFNWSSCLGFTSLNILLPLCFPKHSCKQCSSPLGISFQTCYIFSRFKVIIFLTLLSSQQYSISRSSQTESHMSGVFFNERLVHVIILGMLSQWGPVLVGQSIWGSKISFKSALFEKTFCSKFESKTSKATSNEGSIRSPPALLD